ncbi:putative phage associated protein [Neisseria gonorrhoeae]|uniref:Putative phage associated protein n=1 Tax=Neisseria gonorrhoeae TaxID=485 RepID=A0A378VVF2_NEIGO|nr:putative phage associated protein [Neisseria gonorrhoeae]
MTVRNTQTETVRTEAAPQQGGNTNPGYYKTAPSSASGLRNTSTSTSATPSNTSGGTRKKAGAKTWKKPCGTWNANAPTRRSSRNSNAAAMKNVRRSERLRVRRRHGGRAACRHLRRLLHPRRRRQFAWAAACVEDLLEKMPPEAGRAPHPESPMPPETAGGGI